MLANQFDNGMGVIAASAMRAERGLGKRKAAHSLQGHQCMNPVQTARGIHAKDQFVTLLQNTRVGFERTPR
jgi:hypothetical protein